MSKTLPTNRDQAVRYLYERINYERRIHVPYSERNFKLDRMRRLAERLGNPEEQLNIVHVAGTKGKGSTSTMLASILTSAGKKTGLFTSPHLQRLEERIVIDGEEIPGDRLTAIVCDMIPVIESMEVDDPVDNRPTFFEIVTAIAFVHFQQQEVDNVVLEVGLGGRLDSSNICHPKLCIVTEIDLDHTRQLGDTLEKIAGEKAGIIKPGVPVVCGATKPAAVAVIRDRARELGSEIYMLGDSFGFQHVTSKPGQPPAEREQASTKPGQAESVKPFETIEFTCDDSLGGSHTDLESVAISMMGQHQAANASMALAAVNVLQSHGLELSESQLRDGLVRASCRGRVELVARSPAVILDVGHNEASIRALTETLARHFPQDPADRVVVFATTKGKDVEAMLRILLPWCGQLIVTKYQDNPRGCSTGSILRIAEHLVCELLFSSDSLNSLAKVSSHEQPSDAWAAAMELSTKDSLVCITGSFFLAAELESLARNSK